MTTIDRVVNQMIDLIPNDDREYSLFIQHDKDKRSVYFELLDEMDELVADASYNTNNLVPSVNDLFSHWWYWELRFKIVKDGDKGIKLIKAVRENGD